MWREVSVVSLRIGGSGEDQRRKRKRLLVLVVAGAALVVVWIFLVLALGIGSSSGGGERGNSSASDGGSAEGGVASEDTANQRAQTPEGTEAAPAETGEEKDYATPEDPEQFAREEQRRDEASQGGPRPPGGADHEPAGYDPLGIQRQDVPLTPADRDRVQSAASNFVAGAYGYSGGKGTSEEYLAGVGDVVLSPEFYSSEGAEEVMKYSDSVRKSGTNSAAKMVRWEVESAGEDEVEGLVYFESADGYDRYGELTGEKKTYRQALTLVRYRAVFKVKDAGRVQEVRIK